ncbi:MAG: neutral/alkaline non-lysosomal ceramidase N-terminal domain-containing protein [Trueperaceae bacterium]
MTGNQTNSNEVNEKPGKQSSAPAADRVVSPSFRGIIGVGRADVTPPAGIFSRTWGAARHEVSEGVHKPFFVSALTLQASPGDTPLVVVALDGSWWQSQEDEKSFRGRLLERFDLPPTHLIINLSHTHAGPPLVLANEDRPGGEYVRPYFEKLHQATSEAIDQALGSSREGVLSWQTGSSDLATNRDLPDPAKSRYVTGLNPRAKADDTVLVGRIASPDGNVRGTIVNYACHPTTLAWDNRLLSPDYVGAMRETVEANTGGVPCLFLLGACGELAPGHQYTGDAKVADSHGRRLGFSALAALEAMLPPDQELVYQGVVESGAPLAVWLPQKAAIEPSAVEATTIEVEVDIKAELPSVAELETDLERCEDPVLHERMQRKLRLRRTMGDSPSYPVPVWVAKAGKTLFVGGPVEAYSAWQVELRAAFPDHAVVVMNLANGAFGYLPPKEHYRHDIYSVWQTPFDAGGLESLLEKSTAQAARLVVPGAKAS